MDSIRVLALCFGLAGAQIVSLGVDGTIALPTLSQSCPPILTVTVLPPDYTGIFTNLAGLPTLSVPSLGIDTGLLTNLPTELPSLELPSLGLPSLGLSLSLPTALPSLTLDLPTALPSLTLPFSIPAAIPTNLLPSVTLPTLSIPASALLPTSFLAGPTPTPVALSCAEHDGQTVYENGLLYVLSCGAQAAGDIYAAVTANNTFNDCFTACDQFGSLLGALFCTGFSYVPDASGGGTCFLQNSVAQDLVFGGNGRIGAVRLLNYILGGNLVAPVLSELPTASLALPTVLPTLTLPSVPTITGLPQSSILAGLTTAISLPTQLPVGSIINQLSSELAQLPTNLPLPSDLALSSILSELGQLPTNLPLPTGIALSSVLNGLSSNLAQLTLPTILPTTNVLSIGLPSISLPSLDLGSIIPTPTAPITLPGISLPAISIPTPSVNLGGLTSVINGLTTVLAIPSVSIPSIVIPSVSVPSVSLPVLSIATPSVNLGGVTTILNGLTTVLSVPSVSIPAISIATPVISIPSISLATPTLAPTTLLNGLTTVVALPTLSVPSVSNQLAGLSTVSIALPLTSTNILGGLSTALVLPTTNILGGLSTALVLPTTNVLPGLPGLPTLLPVAASSTAASSNTGTSSSRTTTPSGASLVPTISLPVTSLSVSLPSVALTAVPTATSLPLFSCPRDNGLAYLSSTGLAFIVECGIAFVGNAISTAIKSDLQSCVDSCGAVSGCTGVSYSLGICTYESAVGTGVASPISDGAAPLDLSCPTGNGNTYLDYLGGNYQVLCNTTFPAATIITSPNIKRELAVRALAPAVAPAVSCSGRCSAFSGCIAVFSSATGSCTFLSALGNAGTGSSTVDSIVQIGKRIVAVVSGSTITSTSRATGLPTYTTRTGSAINNAGTATITPITLSLPTVAVSVSLTVGVGAGISAGGLPGLPGLATATGFATSVTTTTASTTVSRITQVLPVTTILTTSTFTSCNQGNNGFITCPVVSVTNTLIATGLII